ncbi:NAD-dependent protein deacylase sirtuin-5, mitochondrial isoform X1 [Cinclus cinclus]|uniref:NAD-dependent protein deacylase sirtuin-5, mitochondrial isoform X1 n=1 Tax=Cinclus cinclus TaxID=127875 RepID=UPI002E101650
MCLFQLAARRLISQAHCGLKAASSKKQKFCVEMARPSSNMADFREVFAKAKHIAIITGAGVSAESGVPTFRGAGGFWRKWQAQELATPGAFARNPSRVWEFYHYRRELMLSKHPNPAHIAIAECEKRLSKQGRSVVVITQNIDELHRKAGTKHLLEIHGLQILTQKMLQFQLKTFLSVRRMAAMGSCGPTSCGLARPWIPVCSRRWRRSWIFVTSAWLSGPRPWCILRPCSPHRSRPEASQLRSSTWNPLLPPTGSGSTSRAPAGPRYRRRWRDTRRRSSPEPRDYLGSGPARRVQRGAGAGRRRRRDSGLRAIKGRR